MSGVREHESKGPANRKVAARVCEGLPEILERQMLPQMGTIDGGASPIRHWMTDNDVAELNVWR
jgi:hypothetical protein